MYDEQMYCWMKLFSALRTLLLQERRASYGECESRMDRDWMERGGQVTVTMRIEDDFEDFNTDRGNSCGGLLIFQIMKTANARVQIPARPRFQGQGA